MDSRLNNDNRVGDNQSHGWEQCICIDSKQTESCETYFTLDFIHTNHNHMTIDPFAQRLTPSVGLKFGLQFLQ